MKTKYMEADDRRALIIEAALRIANANGLVATSFAHVAAECDVDTSPATVRRFFWTKAELWREVVKHPSALPHVRDAARAEGLTAVA